MKYKLKRCPFCNSHDLEVDMSAIVFWVKCQSCGSTGPNARFIADAIDLWNGQHRHGNPSALVSSRKSNHHETKELTL